ncbi:hypothetical protein CONLIGDRAFT_710857 [Coniochaeta ligniaria NRRL 30616]|uniref:Zn(2)-C6 fungal-type domain-containing protein n=1 Tax=Coniochaeta ligniaria NRRL 30616 TaxID=1408157 RepID=A0A1J7IZB0_9PEZI|nr:hypothetical protein CONLIGDRAFT_710857 [Coniochaeta ligniaria NRRL 30616]
MPLIRGRAACDGCRSRKQKCDETKPVCSRCRNLDRSCVWPRVHKRGPVKGYVDLLKQRLEATENALLRLLSAADETTIVAAFGNRVVGNIMDDSLHYSYNVSNDMPGSAEVRKASLTAHWDQFPLRTADEVKRWAQELLKSSAATASSEDSRGLTSISVADDTMSSSEAGIGDMEIQGHGEPSGREVEAGVAHLDLQPQTSPALRHAPTQTGSGIHSQEQEGSLELSQEFKQQYLW